MGAIFFDLETTDSRVTGQILNYCFIAVDERLNPVETLADAIRISRLQLPTAGAILANRTDVLKHQSADFETEPEALRKISQFIEKVIEESPGRVPLIGYNSARFDLPFLRTSMLRNGLNPYFYGKLLSRDLLHVVQKLSVSHPNFPRVANIEKPERLTLALEPLTKKFGLLTGKQSHFSTDDVLLTIDFAKHLLEEYNLDVRTYDPFEAAALPIEPRRGDVVLRATPQYELGSDELYQSQPYTLLDASGSGSLWIDLEKYSSGDQSEDSCVRWFNENRDTFFLVPEELEGDEALLQQAKSATKAFRNVKLKGYFGDARCDIEHHIYKMSFPALDALSAAIWQGDEGPLRKLPKRDPARILYSRFKLAHYDAHGKEAAQFDEQLKGYALYRYGGKMSLHQKIGPEEYDVPENFPYFHPIYNDLLEEIAERREDASRQDEQLLNSLQEFYRLSDIVRVAGSELLELRREPVRQVGNG